MFDEPIFEDPSIFFEQARGNNVIDDLLAGHEVKGEKKGKRRIRDNNNAINGDIGSESKKSVHKDIERQRRQEMAGLCASLRSLLPLEYIKGKRAMCDHMEQAVNYIKDMQNKIEKAKMGRNKLVDIVQTPNSNTNDDGVKVNLLRDNGMEILFTTGGLNKERFPLSKVLAYLLGLGLNVTTSVSTTSQQCTFHKLHIEVNEITSIDISKLKRRLVNMIKVA